MQRRENVKEQGNMYELFLHKPLANIPITVSILMQFFVGLANNGIVMESIFEPATLQAFMQRINKLKPDTQRNWGKMDVAQMMAHCSAAIENTLGDTTPKRNIIGLMFGKFAKKTIFNDKPFKQGLPTGKIFIIADTRNFEKEKQRLKTVLIKLSQGGGKPVDGKMHPFFGQMNAGEWSNLMNKHIDHHLKQFGA